MAQNYLQQCLMSAEMDGIFSNDCLEEERVLIVACSNRAQMVDPAVQRPGRLDYNLQLNKPTQKQLLEILKGYLHRIPNTLSDDDLFELAQSCNGFSGAQIETLIREAALQCVRDSMDSNVPDTVAPITFSLLRRLVCTASE
jgi:ATP-dependent 26S proteasome regulatory subunit